MGRIDSARAHRPGDMEVYEMSDCANGGRNVYDRTGVRMCVKCGEWKPLRDYFRSDRIESGYDVKCKACTRKDEDKWVAHTIR